ncbi:MAG: hypothetical protein ABIS26_00990 [Candidatus Paceibacterota bacterium]
MKTEAGVPNKKPELKIENIKTPDRNEVSFCPERGGIITSLKFNGTEILYFDQATFLDPSKSVKGGIPILFPNAGPAHQNSQTTNNFPALAKHGFAREKKWRGNKWRNGFQEDLLSDEDTKKAFPYDFKLSLSGQFTSDGFFTILQNVENREQDQELPISIGLHPYFRVPGGDKSGIKFEFEGGEDAEEGVTDWANGVSISIENPKIKDKDAIMKIVIPQFGIITMDVSPLYKRIWIWSLPGKDFICVEPVMRDSGGLVDDPEMIPELGELEAYLKIKFETFNKPKKAGKKP